MSLFSGNGDDDDDDDYEHEDPAHNGTDEWARACSGNIRQTGSMGSDKLDSVVVRQLLLLVSLIFDKLECQFLT